MERARSEASVAKMEEILRYRFNDRSLLEEALTHSSWGGFPSYERLEFVGDAALDLALGNFVFLQNPPLNPGQLSLLRAANTSTEKLARVAVRHGFYRFLRHRAPSLDAKVSDFEMAIREEGNGARYVQSVKAPKVLADIVESIAAAVYVDCDYDLKLFWQYFGHVLEPLVTPETLGQQPVTMLYELCQREGKRVDIKYDRKEMKNIAHVYVDGELLCSDSSEQKEIAKINAAKKAFRIMWYSEPFPVELEEDQDIVNVPRDIEGAKQKLNELCFKKSWPKPKYKVEKEVGPAHERKFICSVQIEVGGHIYQILGDLKPKIKDAENSAASRMLHCLLETQTRN